LKLKKTPSFSDWLKGSDKKATLPAAQPWLNKSWDRWEKEILKNVKALH
jgi:hypothetical protein